MQEKHLLIRGANGASLTVMSNEKERFPETLPAFRVTREVYEVVTGVANNDRRKISDVARALLERGVAAFNRDNLLFEPEPKAEEPEEEPKKVEEPKLSVRSRPAYSPGKQKDGKRSGKR